MTGIASRVDLSRLPRTDEHFVGRENELALLDDAWASGKNVFSIVAWGGVGKTALVQHWLGRLAERHYDGASCPALKERNPAIKDKNRTSPRRSP